jgi:hypothetical protein
MSSRSLLRTRVVGLTVAAAALSLAGPVVQGASAKGKGGSAGVTCEGYGGGQPGEVVTTTVSQYVNGKWVSDTTVKHICGNDGKWHTVALVAGGTGVTVGPIQQAAVASARLAG